MSQYISLMAIENNFPIHMSLRHWGIQTHMHSTHTHTNTERYILWHLKAFFLSVLTLQAKYYLVSTLEKNATFQFSNNKPFMNNISFTFLNIGQKENMNLCCSSKNLPCCIQLLSCVKYCVLDTRLLICISH